MKARAQETRASAVGTESPRVRAADRNRSRSGGSVLTVAIAVDGPGTICESMVILLTATRVLIHIKCTNVYDGVNKKISDILDTRRWQDSNAS
jgi:hypothetical protein